MHSSIQLHDLQFRTLFSEAQIQQRIDEIGTELTRDLNGTCPLFISILSGSFVFASDLLRAYKGDCEVRFVKLSSYSGLSSSGTVETVMGLDESIAGRDVVVLEDIVDTGKTFHFFLEQLKQAKPKSIRTVAFLVKPDALQYKVPIDYKGFEIDDKFVVGYGLDYNELGRNLPEIFVLNE